MAKFTLFRHPPSHIWKCDFLGSLHSTSCEQGNWQSLTGGLWKIPKRQSALLSTRRRSIQPLGWWHRNKATGAVREAQGSAQTLRWRFSALVPMIHLTAFCRAGLSSNPSATRAAHLLQLPHTSPALSELRQIMLDAKITLLDLA